MIPTDSRATMLAYRTGHSLEEYLDDMWKRRASESPRDHKSIGKWPFVRLVDAPAATVTNIKRKVKA